MNVIYLSIIACNFIQLIHILSKCHIVFGEKSKAFLALITKQLDVNYIPLTIVMWFNFIVADLVLFVHNMR